MPDKTAVPGPSGRYAIFPDADALSRLVCQRFVAHVQETLEKQDRFRVALSGGSTPKRLYELLSAEDLPWSQIEWFWGDERNVPHEDADSNFRMVREALLDRVAVPEANIFPVPVDVSDPAGAARGYDQTLQQAFAGNAFPPWDLALQGIGDDAHTASLFPETKALGIEDAWFVENWVPKFDAFRYTLTAPAINSAKCIWFLVAGVKKKPAVDAVWNGPRQPERYPSQLIDAGHPQLTWFLTEDALPARQSNR